MNLLFSVLPAVLVQISEYTWTNQKTVELSPDVHLHRLRHIRCYLLRDNLLSITHESHMVSKFRHFWHWPETTNLWPTNMKESFVTRLSADN